MGRILLRLRLQGNDFFSSKRNSIEHDCNAVLHESS
jgi:hypothetical protein